jgi:hypothetical protein
MREIESIEALVAEIELIGIQTFELSGKLRAEPVAPEDANAFGVHTAMQNDDHHLSTRFRLEFQGTAADIVVDVAAHYRFEVPTTYSRELATEFAERVGFMTVYPYLREAVFTTAARMDLETPILGLMKAGQFRVEEQSGHLSPFSDQHSSGEKTDFAQSP